MITVRIFETTEALISRTLELLRAALPTPGNIMLSGGATPYVIYNRLAADPCPVNPDRRLFLSDERMQPPDSGLNNAHNLEPMLSALQCGDRFIRVDTTLSRPEAAEQFEADLQPLKKVDLGFLGMGADGHPAGFFSPEQARITTRITLHTDRPDGMEGVSLTPAFFHRVEKIILLVTGESKRNIIRTLLDNPYSIPAGIALADHPDTELWTDINI